jgi:hypothetical protein
MDHRQRPPSRDAGQLWQRGALCNLDRWVSMLAPGPETIRRRRLLRLRQRPRLKLTSSSRSPPPDTEIVSTGADALGVVLVLHDLRLERGRVRGHEQPTNVDRVQGPAQRSAPSVIVSRFDLRRAGVDLGSRGRLDELVAFIIRQLKMHEVVHIRPAQPGKAAGVPAGQCADEDRREVEKAV